MRLGYGMAIGLWLLIVVLSVHIAPGHPLSVGVPAGLAGAAAVVALLFVQFSGSYRLVHLTGALTHLLVGVCALACLLAAGALERLGAAATILQVSFAFFFLRLSWPIALAGCAPYVVAYVVLIAQRTTDPVPVVIDGAMVLAAMGASASTARLLERSSRELFHRAAVIRTQAAALLVEKERSEMVLRNVLPPAIAERLRRDETFIADHHAEVTVLFVDLAQFTTLAQKLSPAELVSILDEIFGEFDTIAREHGLEKIKTLGDAYMAVAGAPAPIADHAARAVRAGLAMIVAVERVALRRALPLRVRAGAHTGPVVAGVLGRAKLSYDLWGKTVNQAARLEAQGRTGTVHFSEETRRLLPESIHYIDGGILELKGIGAVQAWSVSPEP